MDGFFTLGGKKICQIIAYKGEYVYLTASKIDYSFTFSRGFLIIKTDKEIYEINGFDSVGPQEKKLLIDRITRLEIIKPYLSKIIKDTELRNKFFKLAVEIERTELAKYLIGSIDDQWTCDSFLTLAVEKGNLSLVKHLVKRKEKIASQSISFQLQGYNRFSPLNIACKLGNLSIVKYFRQVIDNNKIFESGCLMALAYEQTEIVKYLVRSVFSPREEMIGLIYLAYDGKNLDIIRFLLLQGVIKDKSGADNFLYEAKYFNDKETTNKNIVYEKLKRAEKLPKDEKATQLSNCFYIRDLIKRL